MICVSVCIPQSGLINRQADEITQLGAAIIILLEQIVKHQPPTQSGAAATTTAAATTALATAAPATATVVPAAGQAGGVDAAVAGDLVKGRHGPEALKDLHQKLTDARVQDLLPPATKKVWYFSDFKCVWMAGVMKAS